MRRKTEAETTKKIEETVVNKDTKPKVEEKVINTRTTEEKKPVEQATPTVEANDASKSDPLIEAKAEKLQGLKVVGKIELPVKSSKKGPKKVASSDRGEEKRKTKKS